MFFLPRLLVAWAINIVALWIADALWDGVKIHGAAAFLIGAAVLGIANTLLKPALTILTLPLIIISLGFVYLLINIAMVALAEWIAPNFSIDGFWTYVGTVVVIWAVNWIAQEVLGGVPKRRARAFGRI
jgi:putative membrane protein